MLCNCGFIIWRVGNDFFGKGGKWVWGDPGQASAQKGEAILAAEALRLAQLIDALAR